MPGYSGTALAKKLGIKPGHRVVLVGAPSGFAAALNPLPENVLILSRPRSEVDVIVLFAPSRRYLQQNFQRYLDLMKAPSGLWIGWPKKSSCVSTDLSFDAVQKQGLASGLVDNKVCALDDTWSGLRFVVRLADRAKWRCSS
jgi:hypothetical protein